jgi:hypothetical protein
VAEIVEANAGQLRAADGRPEDAVAKVVVVQDLALRRREDETELVRLSREQLAAEHEGRMGGEIDAAARCTRRRR